MRIACIGSRGLSREQLALCQEIGRWLVPRGHELVTGEAIGADQAFAQGGASVDPSKVHIWVPWHSYEAAQRPAGVIVHEETVYGDVALAQHNHPIWNQPRPGVKPLMARNARIIMCSEFVLAWPGRNASSPTGGTTHGMRRARQWGNKVLDLSVGDNAQKLSI